MTPGIKASVASVAVALAITSIGVGTAYADTPAGAGAGSVAAQNPPFRPPPPHRFRMRFHSLQQCEGRGGHDHPGRRGDWDCRRGPDRNNPWEYWGD